MNRLAVACALACAAFLTACGPQEAKTDTAAATPAPASTPAPAPAPAPAAAPAPPPVVAPVPPPPPPPGTPAPERPKPTAIEEADCKAKGGTIQPVGLAGNPRCVIPYKDAGKACTDGDDCEGNCWTGSAVPGPDGTWHGTCQPTNIPVSCHGNVEDGQLVGGIMCVD